MSAHDLDGGLLIAGIKIYSANLFVARNPIDAGCNFSGALRVAVYQSHGIHLRRASHIEGGRRSHHAGTNH